MKSIVHAAEKPQEIQYTARKDGMADVWLRRNITQQTCPSDGEGDNLEYVYDEVFFRTTASQEDISGDLDTYWTVGQEWAPEVPLTKEEAQARKIADLEQSLEQAKTDLAQARTDNDMAIAELTIVLATMMTPEVTQEGGEENV